MDEIVKYEKKKINRTWVLLPVIIYFIFGYGSPTIDTSTDDVMQSSIKKVRQSLPSKERADFDSALVVLAFDQVSFEGLLATPRSMSDALLEEKMKDALNGKSAKEIIAEANKIQKERKEREAKETIKVLNKLQELQEKERIQALNEIQELQGKQAKAVKDKEELNKFKIVRSRFYKQKRQYGSDQPVIELTVINKTSYPVSEVYFKGTLASPNRSVPWVIDTFSYKISGGLEPGEKAEWSLAPNMFSAWGAVNAPADAILTVEVEKLGDVNGNLLFSSESFSERDIKRLEGLKTSYKGLVLKKAATLEKAKAMTIGEAEEIIEEEKELDSLSMPESILLMLISLMFIYSFKKPVISIIATPIIVAQKRLASKSADERLRLEQRELQLKNVMPNESKKIFRRRQ